MKTKSHHQNQRSSSNGNISDGPTPSSAPTSPRASHSNGLSHSHSRRRVLCKSFSSNRRRGESLFHRRHIRYLLVMPLMLYFSGLITCVGPLAAMLYPSSPGSVYRSHQIFEKLQPEIMSDNSSQIELSSVWKYRRKLKELKPCLTSKSATGQFLETSVADLYLIVEANGGLNQQRSSICNAVALAGLLNATLLIPRFNFHNIWRDPSEFGDIYDEEHFITALEGHVKVVRELPLELMEKYDFNISNIPDFRVQAWAPASYYLEEVYPVLLEQRIIRIAPFANRLAMNLPPNVQFLRCLANYEALRFASPITTLANKLVNRMTGNSSSSDGKYVSIHLRFEEDMVAFSCCVYDGGKAENAEMDLIRKKGWGDKFKRKNRVIAPDLNRINGRCPMTPLEVGMMLRGMGFSSTTSIYLASGKLYQADRNLAPLKKMFPLLQTKEMLATPDELATLQGYSSRLAALDYLVCLFSEVFVATQGGNFPHFLMGHRKFLYDGHAKTIKPDKQKLVVLLHNTSISWDAFKNQMKGMLAESDHKGIMVPRARKIKRKSSIYSNPLPECKCLWESQNSTFYSSKMLDH